MKQVFFLLFLSFLSFSSFAQIEFSPQGAEWHYGTYYYNFSGVAYHSYFVANYVDDITIDGVEAKIIESSHLDDDVVLIDYDTITQAGYQVFIQHNGSFELLYDFGAQVGDTLQINNWAVGGTIDMIVTQIDTIEINDVELLEFTYDVGVWGIHKVNNKFAALDMNFLNYPASFVVDYNPLFTFRCYSDDAFGFYQKGDIFCDSIILGSEEPKKLEAYIFPNPTESALYISVEQSTNLLHYRIFDVLGKNIQAGVVENRHIDVGHLTNGSYILELTSVSGQIVRHHFLKE